MDQKLNLFKIELTPDNTEISISEDETILTASLRNDIQHLHACGGLGMCSTCRVEILSGEENLFPKSNSEQALSDKLELPSNIRLACQTKVKGNIKLKRLLLDQKDLILLKVDTLKLDHLIWEQASDGNMFPHLYSPLDLSNIVDEFEIIIRDDGFHELPDSF